MQLTVTGKQIDTGTVLRQHVEASLGAILGKYFKTAIEAHVVFSKEEPGRGFHPYRPGNRCKCRRLGHGDLRGF